MNEADDQLSRAADEAMAPFWDDMRRLFDRLYAALGGAEGIATLQRDMATAQQYRARWEAGHPGLRFGQSCHCWCRLRGHPAESCQGEATTFTVRFLDGEPVQVPLCLMCACLDAPTGGHGE